VTAAPSHAVAALTRRRSLSLCYHGLGESTAAADPHFLHVHPDRFRAQIELLLGAGFRFVTVADLASLIPVAGLAALSFDDGMHDNHSVLLPILHEYGITATIYVTTGLLGKPNPWIEPGSSARFMTEDELRDVARAGVEIGAHTVTHPDLATLGVDECVAEMRDSRQELERITGHPVTTFAYPFCSYGTEALDAARQVGFDAAVTCLGRGDWSRPLELPRTMITGKDGMFGFAMKVAGVYEPLFRSPPGRALRAATRGVRGRVRAARERS
jgi:peptidoglycan/xylan/chitin deacetylase (PgdA/CDA1 family)